MLERLVIILHNANIIIRIQCIETNYNTRVFNFDKSKRNYYFELISCGYSENQLLLK